MAKPKFAFDHAALLASEDAYTEGYYAVPDGMGKTPRNAPRVNPYVNGDKLSFYAWDLGYSARLYEDARIRVMNSEITETVRRK